MRRYFMLIPEAVQLVLHVAGRGRQRRHLRAGHGRADQARRRLARNLIRLSGLVPDEDIAITFIGLRPGEKLFEELVGAGESTVPSSIEKVFEVTLPRVPDAQAFDAQVRLLERAARHGEASAVMRLLSQLIPEYTGRPWGAAPAAQAAPAAVQPGDAPSHLATIAGGMTAGA